MYRKTIKHQGVVLGECLTRQIQSSILERYSVMRLHQHDISITIDDIQRINAFKLKIVVGQRRVIKG